MSTPEGLATDIEAAVEEIPGFVAWTDQAPADLAVALTAAGYSKPRTITTSEELDALPIGSVVLSDAYRHHATGMPLSFQRWTDGSWHRGARGLSTHQEYIVPAAVIHEPTA